MMIHNKHIWYSDTPYSKQHINLLSFSEHLQEYKKKLSKYQWKTLYKTIIKKKGWQQ